MENIIELKTTKAYVAEVKPNLPNDQMVDEVMNGVLAEVDGEMIRVEVVYDGFLGGVEITTQEIEERFLNSEDPNHEKWLRSYHQEGYGGTRISYRSLDGTKCLVRICKPHSPTGWTPSDAMIFKMFVDMFDLRNTADFKLFTKSDFQAKIESAEYREPTNEV